MVWTDHITEARLALWRRLVVKARTATDFDGLPDDVSFDELHDTVFSVASAKGLVRVEEDDAHERSLRVAPSGRPALPFLLSIDAGIIEGWAQVVRAVEAAGADPDPDATFDGLIRRDPRRAPSFALGHEREEISAWLAHEVWLFERARRRNKATRRLYAPLDSALGIIWTRRGTYPPTIVDFDTPVRWGGDAESPDGIFVPIDLLSEVLMALGVEVGVFLVRRLHTQDGTENVVTPRPASFALFRMVERLRLREATIADALALCERLTMRDVPLLQ